MARHRIKGKDLADFLGMSTNAVSTLRNADTVPAIGGERWELICDGINKLSLSGDTITPLDLIEYLPQEVSVPEAKHSSTADSNSNRSKESSSEHEANSMVTNRRKRKEIA